MLDVRRLQVLRSVVATGSVSRAAQALGYSPSSISQQIAVLQRETGVQLLEHVGRGIRPTDAARLLDAHAGEVFEQLARTEQALADYRHGRRTRLRLEYFATAGRSLIAPVAAALLQEHPQLQVELRIQPDGEPARRISAGDVDVALTVAETPVTTDGVHWSHLLEDPFDVVLPAGHPLADQPRIELADLAALPWVTHEWPLGWCSQQVLAACAALGFTPQYRVECNDIDTAQGLIAAGLGIGVLPRLGLSTAHPGVTIRPLADPVPVRRIHVLHAASLPAEMTTMLITSLHAAARTTVAAQRPDRDSHPAHTVDGISPSVPQSAGQETP